MLQISHVIPSISADQGGPVHSLAVLTTAQGSAGHRVSVWTTTRASDLPPPAFGNIVQLHQFGTSDKGSYRKAPELLRRLRKFESSLIHSHGIWTCASTAAAAAAKSRKIPHLLAPCGMLHPEALKKHAFKKQLGLLLFQGRILQKADCIQAKSRLELDLLRRFGLKQPIALIPNPIPEPPELTAEGLAAFRARTGLGDKRILLYLGRLSEEKGVRKLLEAWASLTESFPDWRLLLAGPDQNKHFEKICRKMFPGRKYASVVFSGQVNDNEKWAAYANSELFVQPSAFESFGTTIGETLSAGVPVIATTGTPWNTLRPKGCGWWINSDLPSLTETLSKVLAKPKEELASAGARGKFMVREFSVDSVTENLTKVYEWLIGQGQAPECVFEH